LSGGTPLAELISLERGEHAITLVPLDASTPIALGTAHGVVKRLTPQDPPNKDSWEVISLKDSDAVVGAALAGDEDTLVFVTDDGQLLHYSAALVRPQGRSGSGMAGIKVSPGRAAAHFTAVLA